MRRHADVLGRFSEALPRDLRLPPRPAALSKHCLSYNTSLADLLSILSHTHVRTGNFISVSVGAGAAQGPSHTTHRSSAPSLSHPLLLFLLLSSFPLPLRSITHSLLRQFALLPAKLLTLPLLFFFLCLLLMRSLRYANFAANPVNLCVSKQPKGRSSKPRRVTESNMQSGKRTHMHTHMHTLCRYYNIKY